MTCPCRSCARGLWCADGSRGEFEAAPWKCRRCGALAMDHTATRPCAEGKR